MGTAAPAYPTPAVNAVDHEASAQPIPARAKRLSVSPRARALALRCGIDLNSIAGTGPLGRITISDVESVAERINRRVGSPSATVADAPQTATEITADFTVVPLTRASKLTAERMQASLQNNAQLTITATPTPLR